MNKQDMLIAVAAFLLGVGSAVLMQAHLILKRDRWWSFPLAVILSCGGAWAIIKSVIIVATIIQ